MTTSQAIPIAVSIYALYPKKVARPKAIQAILKALKHADADYLLERTRLFAHARSACDPQFTPHPATWFNQERFNDDPSTWLNGSSAGHGPKRAPAPDYTKGEF